MSAWTAEAVDVTRRSALESTHTWRREEPRWRGAVNARGRLHVPGRHPAHGVRSRESGTARREVRRVHAWWQRNVPAKAGWKSGRWHHRPLLRSWSRSTDTTAYTYTYTLRHPVGAARSHLIESGGRRWALQNLRRLLLRHARRLGLAVMERRFVNEARLVSHLTLHLLLVLLVLMLLLGMLEEEVLLRVVVEVLLLLLLRLLVLKLRLHRLGMLLLRGEPIVVEEVGFPLDYMTDRSRLLRLRHAQDHLVRARSFRLASHKIHQKLRVAVVARSVGIAPLRAVASVTDEVLQKLVLASGGCLLGEHGLGRNDILHGPGHPLARVISGDVGRPTVRNVGGLGRRSSIRGCPSRGELRPSRGDGRRWLRERG